MIAEEPVSKWKHRVFENYDDETKETLEKITTGCDNLGNKPTFIKIPRVDGIYVLDNNDTYLKTISGDLESISKQLIKISELGMPKNITKFKEIDDTSSASESSLKKYKKMKQKHKIYRMKQK